jgi:hypothetical protein
MGIELSYKDGYPFTKDGKIPKTYGKAYDPSIWYHFKMQIVFKRKIILIYW